MKRQRDIRDMIAPNQNYPRFIPLQVEANLPFRVERKEGSDTIYYAIDDGWKFKWTDNFELCVYSGDPGNRFEIGSADFEEEGVQNLVWLDHIQVSRDMRRRGIGVVMIHLAALVFGPRLRLPGLGEASTSRYYWHDSDGVRLGNSCLRRKVITPEQLNDLVPNK